jgi:hypothetical protein
MEDRIQMKYKLFEEANQWKGNFNPYEQDATIFSDNYRTRKPNF